MVNPEDYYWLADKAHFCFSLSIVVGQMALGVTNPYPAVGLILIFASVKEAYIDPITETPVVAGSGVRDFLGYAAGAAAGLLLLWARHFWMVV